MRTHRDPTNYYEVLEVQQDAPQPEIHKAYLRAKATYASDNPALYSMFSADETRELLRLIEEAYLVLGNQGARRNYDESRAVARGLSPDLNSNGFTTPSAEAIAESFGAMTNTNTTNPLETTPLNTQIPPAPMTSGDASPKTPMNTPSNNSAPEKNTLPAGMGKTSLSMFTIDDAFESEIQAQETFDGTYLQKIRLYKNVSLDKISDASRISRTYLMAVEANEYSVLPAAVFVRGFVVQMARILLLDEKKVATSYMKLFNASREKK